MTRAASAGLVAAMALVLSAVALAGGDRPSAAPRLQPGASQIATHTGPDFWKFALGARDRLIVDVRPAGEPVSLCIQPPGVTDDTWASTPCATSLEIAAGSHGSVEWPRPGARGAAGDWLIVFRNVRCASCAFSYEFAIDVDRFTRTTLTGPARVHSGKPILLRGQVVGSSGGTVAVARQARGAWASLGSADVGRRGRFTFRFRPRRRGRVTLRASFLGDERHRASRSRPIVIHVL